MDEEFLPILWKREGLLDKAAGEWTPFFEIKGFKDKAGFRFEKFVWYVAIGKLGSA